MNKVALAVIPYGSSFISISRKDNKEDFGLIGGKVEPRETPREAIIRETEEETGLKGLHPQLIDKRVYEGNLLYCYVFLQIKNMEDLVLGDSPEGTIAIKTKEELMDSKHSFSDYNKDIFNLNYFVS